MLRPNQNAKHLHPQIPSESLCFFEIRHELLQGLRENVSLQLLLLVLAEAPTDVWVAGPFHKDRPSRPRC